MTTPQGGLITINERQAPAPPPTAFTFLGLEVLITAPPATITQPMLLTFLLDASVLPPGTTAANLAVFRNGVEAPPCVPGGSAIPDPCVAVRQTTGGDVRLLVRT